MKTKISLLAVLLLGAAYPLHAQETVFFTGFEYDVLPFVFEPTDLNGATDQVGEWSGDPFPVGQGDIIEIPDSVAIIPSPFGGELMMYDRGTGDEDGNDVTGSYFADFSQSIGLLGAEVSFQVGTRRTGGNNEKDYDVVGRGSDGEEAFRLRMGTNNNGGERLGYVTDAGNTVVFDLPTTVGQDQAADLDNMGGFSQIDGPGLGQEIANVAVRLLADGFIVDFSYPEEATSANANAYTTDVLPYNGPATDLAQLEFTYEASTANGRNSGYVLDEVLVTGFEEILQGDFNGDGAINTADFEILKANFLVGTTVEQGDYNLDGQVNLVDFNALKAAAAGGGATAVPEPSGFSMLIVLLGALSVFRRRFSRRLILAATAVAVAGSTTSLQAVDFDGRYIRVTGDQINDTAEALGILRGTAAPRTIEEDVRGKVAKMDIGGGAGSFDETVAYLNGTEDTSKDDFLQQMTGIVTIPAGDWTIGLGSDDGAVVTIPGVEFAERHNATGGSPADEVRFNGTRGHGWTMGEFTLASDLTTQIEAVFFERGGGDSFEVAILDDLAGANDPLGFEILGDGVLGWQVLDFLPGDFDLNGSLGVEDFQLMAANFGTGNTHAQGDMNFSGRVDLADFVEFRTAFLAQPGAAAVPEPSASLLVLVGLMAGMLCRRRR